MDLFWQRLRWGGLAAVCIVYGVVLTSLILRGGGLWAYASLAVILSFLGIARAILAKKVEGKPASPYTSWTVMAFFGTAVAAWVPGPQHGALPILFACTTVAAAAQLSMRRGFVYIAALFLAVAASGIYYHAPPVLDLGLAAILIAVGIWALHTLHGVLVTTEDELSLAKRTVSQLSEVNVRFQNHAVLSREWFLNQERYRIARELHDTMGHTLTGLVVKLQVVEALANLDPDRLVQEIELACAITREAMQEIRTVVSSLRGPISSAQRGPALWTTLCENFAACTGVRVKMDFGDDLEPEVDETVNAVFYRFIQEALTNAYRHGAATTIDVATWRREGALLARVSDNGRGVVMLEEGFGLMGIRERVTELGGEMAWRSEYYEGFDIVIGIPRPERGGDGRDQGHDRG